MDSKKTVMKYLNSIYKTSSFILFAMLTACSSENDEILNNSIDEVAQESKLVQMTFSATVESDDVTRSYLYNSNKPKTLWSEDDKLSVFSSPKSSTTTVNQISQEFVVSDRKNDNQSADFTGTLTEGNPYIALYPYQSNSSLQITRSGVISYTYTYTLTATIPDEQTGVKGSFDPSAQLMTAYTTNNVFMFKNMVSLLKFNIKSSADFKINLIKVEGNNSEGLAGNVSATISTSDGVPTPTIDSNGKKTSVKLKSKGEHFEDGVYYMAICPTQFSKGLTVYLEDTNGKKAYVRISSKSFTCAKSNIYDMGIYDASGTLKIDGKTPIDIRPYIVTDLGLPNGTLWGEMNIAASSGNPYDEVGGYFAWGETSTKDDSKYSWYWVRNSAIPLTGVSSDYAHGMGNYNGDNRYVQTDNSGVIWNYNSNGSLTQNFVAGNFIFTRDYKTAIENADDVAYQRSNGSLIMPTSGQMQELVGNTTISKNNDVSSCTLTSTQNSNYIKLPLGGFKQRTSESTANIHQNTSNGYYWTKTRGSNSITAYALFITVNGTEITKEAKDALGTPNGGFDRAGGLFVRPISVKTRSNMDWK